MDTPRDGTETRGKHERWLQERLAAPKAAASAVADFRSEAGEGHVGPLDEQLEQQLRGLVDAEGRRGRLSLPDARALTARVRGRTLLVPDAAGEEHAYSRAHCLDYDFDGDDHGEGVVAVLANLRLLNRFAAEARGSAGADAGSVGSAAGDPASPCPYERFSPRPGEAVEGAAYVNWLRKELLGAGRRLTQGEAQRLLAAERVTYSVYVPALPRLKVEVAAPSLRAQRFDTCVRALPSLARFQQAQVAMALLLDLPTKQRRLRWAASRCAFLARSAVLCTTESYEGCLIDSISLPDPGRPRSEASLRLHEAAACRLWASLHAEASGRWRGLMDELRALAHLHPLLPDPAESATGKLRAFPEAGCSLPVPASLQDGAPSAWQPLLHAAGAEEHATAKVWYYSERCGRPILGKELSALPGQPGSIDRMRTLQIVLAQLQAQEPPARCRATAEAPGPDHEAAPPRQSEQQCAVFHAHYLRLARRLRASAPAEAKPLAAQAAVVLRAVLPDASPALLALYGDILADLAEAVQVNGPPRPVGR